MRKSGRERRRDWGLSKNVEECGEQVVRADMKRTGDKCGRPASRQQKSPLNEIEASDFTSSTLKAVEEEEGTKGRRVSMDSSVFICLHIDLVQYGHGTVECSSHVVFGRLTDIAPFDTRHVSVPSVHIQSNKHLSTLNVTNPCPHSW